MATVGELRADLHRQAAEAASALAAAEERHARALERYATDAATAQDQLKARLRVEVEAALARHEGALATEQARTEAAAAMAEALRAEMSRQEPAYGALLDQVRATAEAQAARAEEAAAARVAAERRADELGVALDRYLHEGPAEQGVLADIRARLGPVQAERISRFATGGERVTHLVEALGPGGRLALRDWLRALSPVGQYVTRHSRETLRGYRARGLLDDNPTRSTCLPGRPKPFDAAVIPHRFVHGIPHRAP